MGKTRYGLFSFVDAILNNRPIKVFNNGEMKRDFTYIDDIVQGLCKIIELDVENRFHYKLFNIGNNKTETLSDFISNIERILKISASKNFFPIQKGDVSQTWADIDDLYNEVSYKPNTKIDVGLKKFIDWYKDYYK